MQFIVPLAHGIYGPFDEALPLVVAAIVAVLFLVSLIVGRRKDQLPKDYMELELPAADAVTKGMPKNDIISLDLD